MLASGGDEYIAHGNLGVSILEIQEEVTGPEENSVGAGGEGGASGAGKRGLGDSWTEKVNAQAGGGNLAEAGDGGMDTGDAQVGGEPRVGAGVGMMAFLGLGSAGWDYGGVSLYQGQGGIYRSR